MNRHQAAERDPIANSHAGAPRRWLQFMAPVLAGLSALVFPPRAAAAQAMAPLLPHVKPRANGDSLPHVTPRA